MANDPLLDSNMMPSKLFQFLFKLRVYAGLFSIESMKKPKFLMYTYLIGLIVMFSSQIVSQVLVIYFKFSLGDGSDAACVCAMFLENCIIIVFNLRRGRRAEENYMRTVQVVDAILNFSDINESVRSVQKYTKAINMLMTVYSINMVTIQIIQIFIKSLTFLDFADLVPEHYLWIYAMPWPANKYTYWPTLTLESISTFLMIVIQQVSIFFITIMIMLQTLGFKHLRIGLADIIESKSEDSLKNGQTAQFFLKPLLTRTSNSRGRELEQYSKLKAWIKLHSEFNNLCKEFIEIYTPMFMSYFLVVFGILLTAVFALMQNANYFGVMESILLGIYFSGVLFNLFVLSVAGSNVTYESSRIFENVFQTSWYKCSPRIKSSLVIICTVAKRPLILTPLCSEHFTLSLHTFIWVMRAMVSVYIGLAEVKRRAEVGL